MDDGFGVESRRSAIGGVRGNYDAGPPRARAGLWESVRAIVAQRVSAYTTMFVPIRNAASRFSGGLLCTEASAHPSEGFVSVV